MAFPSKRIVPAVGLGPLTPDDEIGQGALAWAVRPQQGMDLCSLD